MTIGRLKGCKSVLKCRILQIQAFPEFQDVSVHVYQDSSLLACRRENSVTVPGFFWVVNSCTCGVDSIHINNINEYIREHPGYDAIELFKVFGFKNTGLSFIKNFVEYDKIEFEQVFKKDNYSTLNKNFFGNDYKQSSRFELESKNLKVGGLIEKDIGEKSIFDNKKIYLRLDCFLKFKRVGWVKSHFVVSVMEM